MRLIVQILLVGFGSALGGLARWGVASLTLYWFGPGFPVGTLFINVSGSLFLGWLLATLEESLLQHVLLHSDNLRLMLAVGFTGAYTTFSTFEYDTHKLLREQGSLSGMTYVLLSLVLGFLGLRAGIFLARLS